MMTHRNIELTQGMSAIVDPSDFEWLSGYKWCAHRENTKVYACTRMNGRMVKMHQVVMDCRVWQMVDHINGDGLDNRRSNLRFTTPALNRVNSPKQKRKNAGQKYKGVVPVSACPGRWQGRVVVDGKILSLGSHLSEESASRAYDAAALLLYGAHANLNFPQEIGARRSEALILTELISRVLV